WRMAGTTISRLETGQLWKRRRASGVLPWIGEEEISQPGQKKYNQGGVFLIYSDLKGCGVENKAGIRTDPKMAETNKKLTKITVELELSKGLEKHLAYLENVSKRSKDFIIREALIQYLEEAEDVSKIYERERKRGGKTYTTKELLEKLNLKEISE
ncbi:17095_t:CDS:2, partial [Funneliformis geosporum]